LFNEVKVKDFVIDIVAENKKQIKERQYTVPSATYDIGNPIEKQYDKIIFKYNGSIVGIRKKEVILIDGKYYDLKLYEIFKKDYDK
jgi:hypothetical protein